MVTNPFPVIINVSMSGMVRCGGAGGEGFWRGGGYEVITRWPFNTHPQSSMGLIKIQTHLSYTIITIVHGILILI